MPLRLWQAAQPISAICLPSAMSIGLTVSVRISSLDCASGPEPDIATVVKATAATIVSFFMDVTPRSLFVAGRQGAQRARAPRLAFCSPRLLRRQACVVRRYTFDDGVAVRHAHIVHQRIAAFAVAVGAQRQNQIIL